VLSADLNVDVDVIKRAVLNKMRKRQALANNFAAMKYGSEENEEGKQVTRDMAEKFRIKYLRSNTIGNCLKTNVSALYAGKNIG
jgi:hypothetical protein